jgi:Competence-damaged protein
MRISSLPFARLVAALRASNKTCTTVEQCCGGVISSSILAQPGASQIYVGGTVSYNTQKCKPLLLNNDELYAALMAGTTNAAGVDTGSLSEEEKYIQSKLEWTARTSVAFCKELETDFAIAEGALRNQSFSNVSMCAFLTILYIYL